MKKTTKSISILTILLIFIVSSSVALATIGVSSPTPLSLKPGDESKFLFQIQSTPGHGDIECRASITEKSVITGNVVEDHDVLEVEFDDEVVVLEDTATSGANIAYVGGTVKVSDSAKINEGYSGEICVSCDLVNGDKAGASTKQVYCAQEVEVKVVKEIVRKNEVVAKERTAPWGIIIVSIIIIIILLLVFFYHYYEKHKEEGKFKVGTTEVKNLNPPVKKKRAKKVNKKAKK